jgi:uncharacterized protein
MSQEEAFVLAIAQEQTVAILHRAAQPCLTGVVVIVGGPQYRVGSHRQFVLLARALADAGLTTLRFDYRGSGDGSGAARDFEEVHEDIRAAIDCLCARSGVRRVVLWGLCDAASAALMYASSDTRVAGMVLLNPWVHSLATEARVRLKTYYLARLRNGEFWRKVLRLQFDWRASLSSFDSYLRGAFGRSSIADASTSRPHFLTRMKQGWAGFDGPVLLILSGDDFTAGEFRELCGSDQHWQALSTGLRVQTHELTQANHTFAREVWRQEVERLSCAWVHALDANAKDAARS